jgi:hypothetical protein
MTRPPKGFRLFAEKMDYKKRREKNIRNPFNAVGGREEGGDFKTELT